MNQDILEIIEYLIKSDPNVKITVNTNASIRSSDWWWNLGVIGGKRLNIVFDIDGCTQEMHAKYRRKTSLEKIKENVEAYCSTQGEASAMTVLFDHNKDHVDEIEAMIRSWGIKGKYEVINSNRFYYGPTFNFINEDGKSESLQEAT